MLNKKVEEAMNKQINAELWSAYLYLSMSAYFESQNSPGFANWMRVQYQEEVSHAMKFFDYINERGGKVKLMAIAEVQTDWKDAIDIFEETLAHEQKVTGMINNLVDLAITEKDHVSNNMLQWYVDEQVEEEANAENLLQQLKMIKDNQPALLILDRELKQRAFIGEIKKEKNNIK
jgi:ferritin